MIIPQYFQEKVIKNFGEKGSKWLLELPYIFNTCFERWNLYDYRFSKDLSINLICFAKSQDFGEVVLKIEAPHPERYTEMRALSLYEGHYSCKCYDIDEQLGALLLERIIPGHDLNSVQNLREQLMIASELIAKIPKGIKDTSGFPTYKDWINKAFKRAREETVVTEKMLTFIERAENFFSEIESLNRPQVLLHGDLHHWNILQDSDGLWKAIDPHGVIGMAFMESARFMSNHLNRVKDIEKYNHLDDMVKIFSNKFGETKRIIAIGFYVLWVLSICWQYEEASPNEEGLLADINECEFILEYIRTL